MLVTEVFFFKASASAWPTGKRLGSRSRDQSRLPSVRPHEIQRRELSVSDSDSEFPNNNSHWIQGKCGLQRCISSQYHANIPVESIPKHTTSYHIIPHRMSSSQKSIHPLHSQSTKFENLEMRRMSTSISKLQNLSRSWRQRHHEQPLGIPGHKRP